MPLDHATPICNHLPHFWAPLHLQLPNKFFRKLARLFNQRNLSLQGSCKVPAGGDSTNIEVSSTYSPPTATSHRDSLHCHYKPLTRQAMEILRAARLQCLDCSQHLKGFRQGHLAALYSLAVYNLRFTALPLFHRCRRGLDVPRSLFVTRKNKLSDESSRKWLARVWLWIGLSIWLPTIFGKSFPTKTVRASLLRFALPLCAKPGLS